MTRLLIFDLDGTLADTRIDICSAVNRTLIRLGLSQLPEKVIRPFIGRGMKKLLMDSLAAAGGGSTLPDYALETFDRAYSAHLLDETVLYPGVSETLHDLAKWDMAVVSNKPEHFCRRMLAELGIVTHFQWVLGGDSLSEMKPSPLALLHVIGQAGARPEETVMVGDSVYDIQAAKAAGTVSVAALYGFQEEAALRAENPDYCVRMFVELADILIS